jgi:hypothetical protein
VKINYGLPIFDMKLDLREFEIVRQQILNDSPGEMLGRWRRLQVSQNVDPDCVHREGAEETAARLTEDSSEIQINFDTGSFNRYSKRRVRLAGDLEFLDDDGTQQWRLDFFKDNVQPILLRRPCDPQAHPTHDQSWRQVNGKNAKQKQGAARKK